MNVTPELLFVLVTTVILFTGFTASIICRRIDELEETIKRHREEDSQNKQQT